MSTPTKRRTSSGARSKRSTRYKGVLQGVGNGVALGWVTDQTDPSARVAVALVVDGELVAEGVADVARADLLEVGDGDGAHGFLLALPPELRTPARRRIVVLAGPEQAPLPTTPSFWQQPSPDGSWSDVVFEPGGSLSAKVPAPPSSTADRRAVVAGGWLFDAQEEESNPTALDDGALQRLAATLTDNARACAALGIAYIPALVPRKRDVIAGASAEQRDWITRLKALLRDQDEVELVDLLGVLRDGARHGSSYHRTDADWNDRGAFYVARALLKEAHKRVPALCPPSLRELRLHRVPEYRGTLADVQKLELLDGQLCASETTVAAEPGLVIDPGGLQALRMPVERQLAADAQVHLRIYAAPGHDEAAHLAIVGDAAALTLVPWLAEHANRSVFFWSSTLPMVQLELECPRVVFHVLREPDLLATLPSAAPSPKAVAPAPTTTTHPPRAPASVAATPTETHPAQVEPLAPRATPSPPPKSPAAQMPPAPAVLTPTPLPPRKPMPTSPPLAGRRQEWLKRWGPIAILAAGITIFGLLMLYDTRRLGFWQDEWSFVTERLGWRPNDFLRAFNQQPMMLTVLVYKLLLPTAGLQHTWPYRLALFGMHGLCVTLLWLLARKRLGDWLALVPAGLLLVLGVAWEDLTLALQVNYLGSLAAGLGALLCLDRQDRRGERLACLLLLTSWMWSSVGVAIALGVAVELAWRRRTWRLWWVVAVPLGLYALWYLGYGSSTAHLGNLRQLPTYFVAGSSATLGGLIGLEELGEILLVGCALLVAWRFLRPEGLSARAAMGVGGFLAFWLITDLNRAQYGQPNASRYMYPAAVLVLIAAVGLLRRMRVPARGYALLAAAMAVVWLSGYSQLLTAAYNRDVVDTAVKAELGAVDVAGPAVSGSVTPDAHHAPVLTVTAYRNAERTLHSRAGFSVAQMLASDEQNRETIDTDLLTWEGIRLVPSSPSTSGSCRRLAPVTGAENHEVELASGHTLRLSAVHGQAAVGLELRRFASQFAPATTATLTASKPSILRFPSDDSTLPWRVRVNSAAALRLCEN